jgi:ABC-type maltose transport system permease subunit
LPRTPRRGRRTRLRQIDPRTTISAAWKITRPRPESPSIRSISASHALRAILPLARPGFAAASAYVAIVTWVDLVFSRMLMSKPENWFVTVGLQSFTGEYLVEWSALIAAETISQLPMPLLFLVLEPFLSGGVTKGAMAT